MIGAIWAQNPHGVIGREGKIPWRYPGDLRRFKRLTVGGAVIMGRKTWESIGKPLSERDNIVISSEPGAVELAWMEKNGRLPASLYTVDNVEKALRIACVGERKVWFIGGSRVYEAAMAHVDTIDMTWVPDFVVRDADTVYAPTIDESLFEKQEFTHEDEPSLMRFVYKRRGAA